MAKKSDSFTSIILQLALGVYFAVSGLQRIIDYDSGLARAGREVNSLFGGSNADATISLIIAIILLVAGILLVVGIFLSLKKNVQFLVGIVLMIIWGLTMVYAYILNNLGEPTFLSWLAPFARDLVLLAVLWVVANRKEV